jgi:protein gp37
MQNSEISWTDHTFNPWWGCIKVSPGCEHCYAETLAHRYKFNVWGPAKTTARRMMSENYWKQPIKWNAAAQSAGTRARVFCASMADVYEDHPQVRDARADLFNLIAKTPHLDWLLLTKRPENIERMGPMAWRLVPPENVWFGTSVENQEQADKRIPELLKVPARVRFLSCEPLLGAVNIWRDLLQGGIHWVIAGGESGHSARPMHPDWARTLRDECDASGVAFHFKQWGEYEPYEEDAQPPFWNDQHGHHIDGHALDILDPETGEMGKGWHEDSLYGPAAFRRVGKHAAGRLLDGRTWDELPQVQS